FLQTTLRLSARSKSQPLVAGAAAQLVGLAAQLAGLAPQSPFHREVAPRFLHCRWRSQLLVAGLAPQQPFHHAVAPRFLLCRWSPLCSARNHNQGISRARQHAPLEHPGTAAGTYPVVQADAYDIVAICGRLRRRPRAEETGYRYT